MPKSSALSFHCMICFEEFHQTERYPVVLPCGHTYVCHICAEKIDKCMECRTVLAWTIPKVNTPLAPLPGWPSSRSYAARNTLAAAARGQPSTPVAKTEKKRLPLPKNVVLLSLMEATELASEMAQRRSKIDSLLDTTVEEEDGEDTNDNDIDEDEKIKLSTSLTVGQCGTYVVADKEGLRIYSSSPTKFVEVNTENEEKVSLAHQDVNAMVRFFHLDNKVEVSWSEEESLKKASSDESVDRILKYGDRVQIVSLDDGWAKLARGYGFVRANARQLVKIGGSVDRACRIEALLHSLSIRLKELRSEQTKADNRFVVLVNNLQTSLINDEDLTVIPGDTFGDPSSVEPFLLSEAEDIRSPELAKSQSSDDSMAVLKPRQLVRQPTPPIQGGYSCFGSSVLQAIAATVGSHDLGCDSMIEREATRSPPSNQTDYVDGNQTDYVDGSLSRNYQPGSPSFPPSPPSPGSLSAGARAWREQNGQKPIRGVDFRTGMSGHQGLVSYMVHPHAYLEQSDSWAQRPRMSSYSGLTISKRKPQNS